MEIITNLPGVNGVFTKTKKIGLLLVVQMPDGIRCTGGLNGNACLARCRNGAPAGPFGGCAAMTNAGASAGAKCARSDISDEEADAVLSGGLYKRAIELVKSFEKKCGLKTRIIGASETDQWI